MSLCLTPEELRELTDLEQPAAQVRWLRARDWQFEVGASGRPKVARSYFQARLGAEPQEQQPASRSGSSVDLAALDALAGRH